MNEIGVIRCGALLLCGERIQAVGPASRVENLAEARLATEVDATGKIILPAFVETDAAIHTGGAFERCSCSDHKLRVSSQRKLTGDGLATLEEYAKHGTLVTGAAARPGTDPRIMTKLLKVQTVLQDRVTRLCNIAVLPEKWDSISDLWFRSLRKTNTADMIEITLQPKDGTRDFRLLAHFASIAAGEGFALRFRIRGQIPLETLALAAAVGPVSLSDHGASELLRISDTLCDGTVLSFGAVPSETNSPAAVRTLIDLGSAVSLSGSAEGAGQLTRDMQHSLFVARKHFKMSAEEALTAATYNAACALDAGNRTGSLEPGKFADLVMLDHSDYREVGETQKSSNVLFAMRGGHCVYRPCH